MEKVILHRCPFTFIKHDGHGCHAVQRALEDEGIEFRLDGTVDLERWGWRGPRRRR